MTQKCGTSPACAACKYRRRKCSGECPLLPYFPHDQPKMFQNTHKLFSVSNILKILEQLDPVQRTEAMRSIIAQANFRERFPVHGCCGAIAQLQWQIRQAEEELYAVLTQLAFFRQQNQHDQISSGAAVAHNATSQLQALSLFHEDAATPQQPVNALPIASSPEHSYPNSNNFVAFNSGYIEKDNLVNSIWVQNPYGNGNNNNNNNQMGMQSQLVGLPQLNIQQEPAQDELHRSSTQSMTDNRTGGL